ncbi:MAG: PIN domain-containing protein, partial [Sphingobacteriaceae bacterium]
MPVKDNSDFQGKIFVLDTSVILHDHVAFRNFQEHDVAIPIQVLEELDNFKNGNENRNFEARSFIRIIDTISHDHLVNDWLPIGGPSRGKFKIVLDEKSGDADAEAIFGAGKFDHRILNAALFLRHQHPGKKVILVSKDICLRLKAKALNIYAEDYETGKVKNLEKLYTGSSFFENVQEKYLTDFKRGKLSIDKLGIDSFPGNHFLFLKSKKYKDMLVFYSKKSEKLHQIDNQEAFRISSLNPEQA